MKILRCIQAASTVGLGFHVVERALYGGTIEHRDQVRPKQIARFSGLDEHTTRAPNVVNVGRRITLRIEWRAA
jgi:hypothetical protein